MSAHPLFSGSVEHDEFQEIMDRLIARMGLAEYCIWLATIDPPLDERPDDAEIIATLRAKLED